MPADPCVGMNSTKAAGSPICYRNHYPRRPDIDIIENSLSKAKKLLEHQLECKKRVPDRAGANAAGEKVGASASLLRPDLHVVTSGHHEEGGGISIGVLQII